MNDELINSQSSHEPITVLVSRRPRKGKEREFEKALSDTINVALQFPGHLGVSILKPQLDESDAYRILVKFDSATHYQQWYRSPEAVYWFNVLARLEAQPPNFEVMTGLEAWFTVSNFATFRPIVPPPRTKMALLTWLAIFPLIVGINLLYWSRLFPHRSIGTKSELNASRHAMQIS
jgi:antibiotic biosynthesis monooxygenase (ABM) superfamily enzyme